MENKSSGFLQQGFFWLRAAVFLWLTIFVLNYTAHVLTPKQDYGICSMENLYYQEDNTVDVLVLGTSLAYSGVNTNVLWQEYGIASYDLCSAEQPFWVSYYYLQEALKTQSPKLIVLDAKPAIYNRDYSKEGRTILSTFGIRTPSVRFEAIRACVGDASAMEFALAFPKLHDRYSELTLEDFRYPADNGGRGSLWKGYIEQDSTEKHEKPSLVWVGTGKNMNVRQQEYARMIFELARDLEIPLVLLALPCPDYAADHMYYNTLAAVAAEYEVPFLNYNAPDLRFGLRWSSDFADWQHLNIKGSVTFTRRLGNDLQELFSLPDRRNDDRYDSYADCAEHWFAEHPGYLPEEV